jgi:ribosomal protein S18 acetylase RimI-like enzyme
MPLSTLNTLQKRIGAWMGTSFSFPTTGLAALTAPYQLREQRTGDDDAFAAELYRSTRDDLRQIPGDPAIIEQLMAMQQRAQITGYQYTYPQASCLVLQRAGIPIGRLVIHRQDSVLRLVDIAILPAAQRQGAALAVLTCLQTLATNDQLRIELAVRKGNLAARSLYQRMGFRLYGEDALQEQLAWSAA